MPLIFLQRMRQASLAWLWQGLAAALLALVWLLPNHARPWTAFHADWWCALLLCVFGLVLLVRVQPAASRLSFLPVAAALLALVPALQFAAGLLPYAGQAWISGLYLFGFALAVALGESVRGERADALLRVLALALVGAAAASVMIQLYQWAGQSDNQQMLDIWLNPASALRPSANLGQPNQLATLLLWGMGGALVLRLMSRISLRFALFILLFLALGLALTQSRAGALGLLVLLVLVWRLQRIPAMAEVGLRGWHGLLLLGVYLGVLFGQELLASRLLIDAELTLVARSLQESRLQAWRMFWDALWLSPWWGYGWFEVMPAQLAVAAQHPHIHSLFAQAHNLFLDLMLWLGLPLGLALSLGLLGWFALLLRRAREPLALVLLAMLAVVGLHAMVELPLHYGYFLWPTGVLLGLLNQRLQMPGWVCAPLALRRVLLASLGAGVCACALVLADYLPLEQAAVDIQLEQNRVLGPPAQVPQVVLFDQLQEQLWLIQYRPHTAMTAAELERVHQITRTFPSALFLMKYILALALAGQFEEATRWMHAANAVSSASWQPSFVRYWSVWQQRYPALQALPWPALAAGAGGARAP